jgi:hypothetical protein
MASISHRHDRLRFFSVFVENQRSGFGESGSRESLLKHATHVTASVTNMAPTAHRRYRACSE